MFVMVFIEEIEYLLRLCVISNHNSPLLLTHSFFLSLSVDDAKTLEDDAIILRVIEAYCTSTKARQTVNSCEFTLRALIVTIPLIE